jgi:hypothetical protein
MSRIYEIRGGWFSERFRTFAVIDDLADAFELIVENAQRRIGEMTDAQKQNLRGHIARVTADPDATVSIEYAPEDVTTRSEAGVVFYEIRKAEIVVRLHRANLRVVQ